MRIQPISSNSVGTTTSQTSNQRSGNRIQSFSTNQSPLYKPGAFVQNQPQQVSQPQPSLIQKANTTAGNILKNPVVQKVNKFTDSIFNPLNKVSGEVAKGVIGFVKGIPSYAKAAVKNPVQTVGGVGQAVVFDFGGSVANAVEKGAAKVIGVKVPERWDISKQQKAFKEWGKMNLEAQGIDKAKAFEAGEFIGAFIPYTIASEVAALSVGSKIATPIITKFLPKAKFLIPKISNVIGFSGVGQLEYDKEVDGERVDRLKNDVIMLGLFEGGSFLAKGLSIGTKKVISKTYNNVSSKFKSGKPVEIAGLEKTVTETKQVIAQDTGKPAGVTLANNIANASEKEIAAITSEREAFTILHFPGKLGSKTGIQNLAVKLTPEQVDYFRKFDKGGKSGLHLTANKTEEGLNNSKVKLVSLDELGKELPQYKDVFKASPESIKPSLTNENVKLVEEAIQSGDLAGAKALHADLAKESQMPSFTSIKQSVDRNVERQSAQAANATVDAVKTEYGNYESDVAKMKSLLRQRAESTSKTSGELYREHIPKGALYKIKTEKGILESPSSDEIASTLGMSENEFMQKILGELDITKTHVPSAPKEVAVPREQLPIGQGKEKVSKLEARMKGVIGKVTQEQKDQLGLSTYNTMNNPDTIKKAADYAINNSKDAIKVLEGKIEPPAGLNSNSIFVAMANNPELSSELAIKLASLKSTAIGQNIEILKALDPNNPVKIASDIYKIKEAEFVKRYGGKTPKEITDKYVEKGRAKITPPKLSDWSSIIKEVRC